MPKLHNIGPNYFVQFFRYPVKWGMKIVVRGESQEIDVPFRTAKPLMIRMPFYRVLVIGKWTGQRNEEDALKSAIQERVLTDEDFLEGWQPPPEQNREESGKSCHL